MGNGNGNGGDSDAGIGASPAGDPGIAGNYGGMGDPGMGAAADASSAGEGAGPGAGAGAGGGLQPMVNPSGPAAGGNQPSVAMAEGALGPYANSVPGEGMRASNPMVQKNTLHGLALAALGILGNDPRTVLQGLGIAAAGGMDNKPTADANTHPLQQLTAPPPAAMPSAAQANPAAQLPTDVQLRKEQAAKRTMLSPERSTYKSILGY